MNEAAPNLYNPSCAFHTCFTKQYERNTKLVTYEECSQVRYRCEILGSQWFEEVDGSETMGDALYFDKKQPVYVVRLKSTRCNSEEEEEEGVVVYLKFGSVHGKYGGWEVWNNDDEDDVKSGNLDEESSPLLFGCLESKEFSSRLQQTDGVDDMDVVRTHVQEEYENGNLATCVDFDPYSGFFWPFLASKQLLPPTPYQTFSKKCLLLWEACQCRPPDKAETELNEVESCLPSSVSANDCEGDDNGSEQNDNRFEFIAVENLKDLLDGALKDLNNFVSFSSEGAEKYAQVMNSYVLILSLLQSILCSEMKSDNSNNNHGKVEKIFFERFPKKRKYRKKNTLRNNIVFFIPSVNERMYHERERPNNLFITGIVKNVNRRGLKRTCREVARCIDQHHRNFRAWLHQKICSTRLDLKDNVRDDRFTLRMQQLDDAIEGAINRHRVSTTHAHQISKLQRRLSSLISYHHMFRPLNCYEYRLSVYGSSFTHLSIEGSDCDLSLDLYDIRTGNPCPQYFDTRHFNENHIMLPPTERSKIEEKIKKKKCYILKGILSPHFVEINGVPRARIPVISARDENSVSFDICLNNYAAVVNSTLLKEYANLDGRVTDLIIAVKIWAKVKEVGSAKDGTLSSYSWACLVIFFLQRIEFIPNLQSRSLILDVRKLKNATEVCNLFLSADEIIRSGVWKRPPKSISIGFLFYGFFKYYASYFNTEHLGKLCSVLDFSSVFPHICEYRVKPFQFDWEEMLTYSSPHFLGAAVLTGFA